MPKYLLLAMVFTLPLAACGAPDPGGPVASVIPADASEILYVPNLDALRVGASEFTAGLDGAAGLVDLIAERYGLDFRSAEALDASGFDARGGLAVYRLKGGTAFAVSVHRPDAFMDHMGLVLLRALGGRPVAGPEGSPRLYTLPNEASPRLAVGMTPSRVGLVFLADAPAPVPPDAPPSADIAAKPTPAAVSDPAATWRALAALPPASQYTARPAGAKAVTAELVAGVLPALVTETAGSIATAALESLGPWHGGLDVTADRVGLAIQTPVPADTALPLAWVKATKGATPLATTLPLNTPFFMRLAFNSERVRRLPGFVRDSFIPERLPGLEGAPMPNVGDLIETLGDEVGIAIFGLESGVPLSAFMNVNQLRARWSRLVRFAFLASIHDRDKLVGRFELIAAQFTTAAEWTVVELPAPEGAKTFRGWTFVRGQESYAAIIEADVFTYVSGATEVDNLMAVRTGKMLSLAASTDADGPNIQAEVTRGALGLTDTIPTIGIHIGFLRVTRELVERGAPPYFIKVLNSIHSFAVGVAVRPDAIELGLEVRL